MHKTKQARHALHALLVKGVAKLVALYANT